MERPGLDCGLENSIDHIALKLHAGYLFVRDWNRNRELGDLVGRAVGCS